MASDIPIAQLQLLSNQKQSYVFCIAVTLSKSPTYHLPKKETKLSKAKSPLNNEQTLKQ
jgi:hypothetical protein